MEMQEEITRTSSKGQVVIPRRIRKKLGIRESSLLFVTSRNGLVIMKKISPGISKGDLKTLRDVEEAWRDIEMGRYKVYSKESFLKELAKW